MYHISEIWIIIIIIINDDDDILFCFILWLQWLLTLLIFFYYYLFIIIKGKRHFNPQNKALVTSVLISTVCGEQALHFLNWNAPARQK